MQGHDDQTTTADRLQALRRMSYHAYLQTPEWRRHRNRALSRAQWRCEYPACQTAAVDLEVHHRHYDHLGEEHDEDLVVLCGSHHLAVHRRADRFRALHWRVIRDVINTGPYASFADFAEEVKVRFARLKIRIDPHELGELLAIAVQDVRLEAFVEPTRYSVREDPAHISEAEARALLAAFDVQPGLPMTAVRQLSDEEIIERHWRADQRKAYRMVQQQILETVQRVAALEDAVEKADREP
jgi:hypothetical protein